MPRSKGTAPESSEAVTSPSLGGKEAINKRKTWNCTCPGRGEICEECKGRLRGWVLHRFKDDNGNKQAVALPPPVAKTISQKSEKEHATFDTADRWLERYSLASYRQDRRWWRGERHPACHYRNGETEPEWMELFEPDDLHRSSTFPSRLVGPTAERLLEGPTKGRWAFFKVRGPEVFNLSSDDHETLPLDEYDPFLDEPLNEGRATRVPARADYTYDEDNLWQAVLDGHAMLPTSDADLENQNRRLRVGHGLGTTAGARIDLLSPGGFGVVRTSTRPAPKSKSVDVPPLVIRAAVEGWLAPAWPLVDLGAATRGRGRPNAHKCAQRTELARLINRIPTSSVSTKALAQAFYTTEQTIWAIRRVIQSARLEKGEDTMRQIEEMESRIRDDIRASHDELVDLIKSRLPDSMVSSVDDFIESVLGSTD